MRKLFRLLVRLAGLLVVLIVLFTGVMAYRGSWFRDVQPAFDGSCEALPLEGSAEDIQLDRERGIAYLSVLDRRALASGGHVQGTVLAVDLKRQPLAARAALAGQPAHFRPHGLSLYVDSNGTRYLYVLNHPVQRGREAEMVELFRQAPTGLFEYSRRYTDPLLVSPNDLVAVGPAQFYVANDKPPGGFLRAALQQLGIGGSQVIYFDNGRARAVVSDIASGGGINRSPDGGKLYVSETAGQRIRVLEREPVTGDLTDIRRIAIDSSPDNIDVAPDGSLWIGAHANTLKLIEHFAAGKPAPSQVIHLRLRGDEVTRENVFLDDGRLFSASSVGVNYGKLVLIGSITEKKLLVCTLAGG